MIADLAARVTWTGSATVAAMAAGAWWLGGGTWPLVRAAASYLPTPVRDGLAALRALLRRAHHE